MLGVALQVLVSTSRATFPGGVRREKQFSGVGIDACQRRELQFDNESFGDVERPRLQGSGSWAVRGMHNTPRNG